MNAVLLSGVHGVGKGYLTNHIKNDLVEYQIYSASGLIERYKSSDDAGFKRVKNVNQNQEILIMSIRQALQKGEKNFILDGHLCIFNRNGNPERIPEYFFEKSGISGIILLQDDATTISERIRKRDGQVLSIEKIENMQSEETRYANELEEKYGMNILRISPDVEIEVILDWLKNVEDRV